MERNLSKQKKEKIIEINHRCDSNNLLLMLENGGSPSLSTNVIVEGYDINSDGNKPFGEHKIYIKPEKLNLGENFILFGRDFFSAYYKNVSDLIRDLEMKIDSESADTYTLSAIYYPKYGFIGNSNSDIFFHLENKNIKEIFIYFFKEFYGQIFSEKELDYIDTLLNDYLSENTEEINEIKVTISKIILIIIRNIINGYNIETTFKACFYGSDEYFGFIKRTIKDYLCYEMETIENGTVEDDNNNYNLYLSIYNKIHNKVNYNQNMIEELLNKILFVPTSYTEGKILMEQVPLNFWQKIEIDSTALRDDLDEQSRNKILGLLDKNDISYKFV